MDVRDNRFLEAFSPGGRERVLARVVYQEVVAGEYLFHEGDPAHGVCLVLEGEIEIVRTARQREEHLATFSAGDYFGEVAILDGHGRSSDARAHGAASVAWLPAADLLEVLLTEPVTLTLQLFQNVLTQLRKTNDLFVSEVVHKEKLSLIGEMAGSLMHDLRNPVQVILSSVDLLKIYHSDPETMDCCNKMVIQCDRLTSMAGELLEFSKGETKLDLVRTDTQALMLQFESFNEDALQAAGVHIEIESEPADIEVDAMRLLRVLQNLVFNAIQALNLKMGGRVDLRAWVADSILYISVRDNGPGIPLDIRDRLFEPFVTHGKPGGTGLGLAIVKNIVASHRGQISFETQAGQGTEFLIRLPQDSSAKSVV